MNGLDVLIGLIVLAVILAAGAALVVATMFFPEDRE